MLMASLLLGVLSLSFSFGLEYPPSVHNLSVCGLMESKLFRDGFVTFFWPDEH